jgi:hypothetical protein
MELFWHWKCEGVQFPVLQVEEDFVVAQGLELVPDRFQLLSYALIQDGKRSAEAGPQIPHINGDRVLQDFCVWLIGRDGNSLNHIFVEKHQLSFALLDVELDSDLCFLASLDHPS